MQNHRGFLRSGGALPALVALVFAAAAASAQSEGEVLAQQEAQAGELEEVEAAAEPIAAEEEAPLELAAQTVTGTRLPRGDPSARVYSFSAEQIARRGVSTLEEFFRKLPWSQASLTTQTGNLGSLNTNDGLETEFFYGNGLGVSAINLRGLGWENTLVLMNGRRIAGSAGHEDDFVNLLNVPLSAIERVDIQLDGASAVYGSDAIGGVVNFITRKNYRGLSATYRHEYSSTDADASRANLTAGYAWGSGNVTAIVSHAASKPITNAKTGWNSLDLRPLFGPEPDFDRRDNFAGQPGVVCILERNQWSPQYPPSFSCPDDLSYQLPAGHSGAGASEEDFGVFSYDEPAIVPLDELPPQNGIDGDNSSVTISLEQDITYSLRVFGDLRWSINEQYQEYDRRINGSFLVPASNAWNPFGKPVEVGYAPIHESGNGIMPVQHDYSENESRTIALGFIWDITGSHQLQVDANYAKSWRETRGFRAEPTRGYGDPTAAAFYAALSSSDPAVALNVFGNGTAQTASFDEFLTEAEDAYGGVTDTRQYTATLRGRLFDWWGAGPITYVVGGEYRESYIYSEGRRRGADATAIVGVDEDPRWILGTAVLAGVPRPSRDNSAWFLESAVPLIGSGNGVPFAHSLTVTLQMRWDVNETRGASDGFSRRQIPVRLYYWDPFQAEFDYVESTWNTSDLDPSRLHTAKVTDSSPRLGLQYQPTPNMTWRLAWRRSFTAPVWSEQFTTREAGRPRPFGSTPWGPPVIDPYDPDGPTEITRDMGVLLYAVPYTPDLEAEYGDNWSVGLDWSPPAVQGLRLSVDWSKVDFTNRIAHSSNYIYDNPEWLLDSDKIGVRNERGDLIRVNSRRINLAGDYNELMTTSVEYAIDTRWGGFRPRITHTRYLEDYQQVVADAPRISNVGTQAGPNLYQWTGSVSWQWDRWSADLYVYYTPSYVNKDVLYCDYSVFEIPDNTCERTGTPEDESVDFDVSSLTTVDLSVSYSMDNGLRIRFGGANVLDRAAPVTLLDPSPYSLTYPYDPGRWDARGRMLFLEVNYER